MATTALESQHRVHAWQHTLLPWRHRLSAAVHTPKMDRKCLQRFVARQKRQVGACTVGGPLRVLARSYFFLTQLSFVCSVNWVAPLILYPNLLMEYLISPTTGISCIHPDAYAMRFLEFIASTAAPRDDAQEERVRR